MLNSDQYFTGTIVEVIDSVLYQIKVDIPGIAVGVLAFPMRGEIDEPKVGDFVLLRSLDPVFKSYFLYQKIKENNFIGFRSNGKMVDITPDSITIAIYDPSSEFNDSVKDESFRPKPTDWVKLDKDGNLEVNLRADANIIVKGNCKLTIEGNSTVETKGDSSINVSGSTTLESPDITIKSSTKLTLTGGGMLETGNKATCSPTQPPIGGFCGIPVCPFSGASHVGNVISGI